MERVEQYLITKIQKDGCIHISLIDPEETSPSKAALLTKSLEQYGTAAIMIGGSTVASTSQVDEVVKSVKSSVQIPVILFPNNVSSVSRYADAIWFMSLMNSNNPLFITGLQALAAPMVKRYCIEPIPLAYLIVGEESTAAYIGQAHTIPYTAMEIAISYSLAAEYLGMRFVYLEAGSGAKESILPRMVTLVKESISIPLIIGGGIKDRSRAIAIAKAGADVIVTGTVLEDEQSRQNIKEIIDGIRTVK